MALHSKLPDICFTPKRKKQHQLIRRLSYLHTNSFWGRWAFFAHMTHKVVFLQLNKMSVVRKWSRRGRAKLPHLVACHQLLILPVRRQSDYTLVISAVVIPWFNTHRAPLKSNTLAVWPSAAPSKSIKDVEAQSVLGALSLKINMLAKGKAKQATCDILMASSVVKSPKLNPFSNLYFSTQRSTHANRGI